MTFAPTSDAPSESKPLTRHTKLAYGLGEVASATVTNIRVFFLLYFLTQVAGLDAALAGTVLLIGRIWDGINDPLIGWLSDRTRTRWGKRHPWLVFGILPYGLLFCLLWIVPPFQGWLLFAYYVFVAIIFDTVYTSVVLPYFTLASEITQDYNERTSLISTQAAFSVISGISALVLSLLIFGVLSDPQQKYLVLAAIIALISVVAIVLCAWGTRDYAIDSRHTEANPRPTPQPFWRKIRRVFGNRAFQLVTGMYVLSWVSVQVSAAVLPYYVMEWMKLPDTHVSQMGIVVQGTAFLAMFVWGWVGQRWGKKAVFFSGIPILMLSQTGLFFLAPSQPGLMYLCGAGIGIGLATIYLVPWSMLPDVIDLDELHHGDRQEGMFYGFMLQMQKAGLAIALFSVGKGLDMAGLIPRTPDQTVPPIQPESVLLAIRLEMGPLPALLLIIGLGLAVGYPISRQVHQEIRLKIRERRSLQPQESLPE